MPTIEELYRNVLGREADPGGLRFWTAYEGDPLSAFIEAAQSEKPGAFYNASFTPTLQVTGESDQYTAGPTSALPGPAPTPDIPTKAAQEPVVDIDYSGMSDFNATTAFSPLSTNIASTAQTVTPPDYTDLVNRTYQNVLGRSAEGDAGGMDYWKGQLASGALTPDQFASAFKNAAAPELAVQQLYRDVLGREYDPLGLSHWTAAIGADGITPAERQQFVDAAIAAGELKAPTTTTAGTGAVSQAAGQTTGQTTGQTSGALSQVAAQIDAQNAAATGTQTGTQTTAQNTVMSADGKEYDKATLLSLAQQIIPNIGSFGGGAFQTKGESIGFDYNTIKDLLGKDPSVGEQVVLDMARGLIDQGITDISQLSARDVYSDVQVIEQTDDYGNPTGRYTVTISDDPERGSIVRDLTADEAAKVVKEISADAEGGQQIRNIAKDVLTGKGLYYGDKLLSQVSQFGSEVSGIPLGLDIGQTFSGPGKTMYQVVINPATGKPQFMAYGGDTGEGQLLNAALTMASFIPVLQPFAMAANGLIAASKGDYIGALASMAGAGGYTNVATALNVANALDKGNVVAAVSTLMQNPNVANAAGATMLTDTISLKDVGTAINIAKAAETGNWGGVLTGAGQLTNSTDVITAGAATTIIQSAANGDLNGIVNGVKLLDSTIQLADKIKNTEVVTSLATNLNNNLISTTGQNDIGSAAYVAAKNAGATDQEALDAANTINNVVSISGDKADTTMAGDSGADTVSGSTGTDFDEFAGFDAAGKATVERTTLNIGNAEADSPEEAAALAASKGYTNFTYGGKTYATAAPTSEINRQVTNQKIASQSNFDDAYKVAREELGPGQTFQWNGKSFTTDTRQENPALAAASDQIKATQTNSTYTKADVDKNISNIDLSALDQAQTYGTFDPFLKSAGLGGEYVIVDDKISKQIITPVVNTVGLITRGVGGIADWTAGALQSIEVIDKDSPLIKIAADLKQLGAQQAGDYILGEEKQFIDRIVQAEGADKITALIEGIQKNPLALLTLGTSEGVEELPSIVGGIVSIVLRAPKVLAYGINALTNLVESAGAGYNETKAQALASGKGEAESHNLAQKSSASQGMLGLVLGSVAEFPLIKRAGELVEGVGKTGVKESTKEVGKTVGREMITESIEGGGASGLSSYFATGKVDMNQVLTSAVLDPVIAGTVTGTVATTIEVAGNKPATAEVISAATSDPSQAQSLINTINATMQPGTDLKQAGADIVSAMTLSGMNLQQAQSVANTAVAEQVLTNINSHGELNIPNLNIAVGADKYGNAVTLGDFIGSSVTGTGDISYVSPDIYIGTGANGKSLTVGDLSSLSALGKTETTTDTKAGTTTTDGTTTSTQNGVTTQTSTDTKTGADITTTINANTGVNTSTSTDTKSGTETTTSTNTNTGTTTQTTTDTNTGTTTNTTSDTNTNTNTQTSTNSNTNTETTTNTNTNTNVTTQTTVNNNTGVTTTSTTDTNGTVTSKVTTDTNNNTETTTTTDTDTNTQTTVVTDLNTNTVISTTVNDDPQKETIDPVETVDPVEPDDKTKTKKPKEKDKKKQSAASMLLASGFGAGDITGLDPMFLKSYVTGEKKLDPIAQVREIQEEMERDAMMQNIDPRLAAVLQQRMGGQQAEDLSGLGTLARVLAGSTFNPAEAEKAQGSDYYSYGSESPIDTILGSADAGYSSLYAAGGYVEPLMAQGGMTLPLLAKKGGLPKMAEGREDFRDGKHVAGEGDGQSDDIPALLADGEFVFPADVVSALGNGSSKAGTDKLYEMMHEIRKRARSTGKKDLPPPALKSPLDYLKSKR